MLCIPLGSGQQEFLIYARGADIIRLVPGDVHCPALPGSPAEGTCVVRSHVPWGLTAHPGTGPHPIPWALSQKGGAEILARGLMSDMPGLYRECHGTEIPHHHPRGVNNH